MRRGSREKRTKSGGRSATPARMTIPQAGNDRRASERYGLHSRTPKDYMTRQSTRRRIRRAAGTVGRPTHAQHLPAVIFDVRSEPSTRPPPVLGEGTKPMSAKQTSRGGERRDAEDSSEMAKARPVATRPAGARSDEIIPADRTERPATPAHAVESTPLAASPGEPESIGQRSQAAAGPASAAEISAAEARRRSHTDVPQHSAMTPIEPASPTRRPPPSTDAAKPTGISPARPAAAQVGQPRKADPPANGRTGAVADEDAVAAGIGTPATPAASPSEGAVTMRAAAPPAATTATATAIPDATSPAAMTGTATSAAAKSA